LKKNGGIPRAPGDVLCGGLPHIQHIYQKITQLKAMGYIKNDESEIMMRNVGNVHQFVNHIHHEYLNIVQNRSYQNALKAIRIKYILGRMSEDDFGIAVFRENKKDAKFQKKKQLLQMVDNVGTDLMQNYNVTLDKKESYIAEMVKLVRAFTEIVFYFNELSYKYHSEFNSWIGKIKILMNNKEVEELCSFGHHDVIKYRY
jgi:hypothetical protein